MMVRGGWSPTLLAKASIAFLCVVSACNPPGLSQSEAVEVAMRVGASQSNGPLTVESAREGPIGQFIDTVGGESPTRRVWAVKLAGSFEGEGVLGHAPRFGHYLVIVDAETGEYVMGSSSN